MNSNSIPKKYNNISKNLEDLKIKNEVFWTRRGEKRVLNLFQAMAQSVPAYKDFLKKNNCNPGTIRTFRDFKNIPILSKDNYLKKYSLTELSWNSEFTERHWDISSTSGSTGEPFYFPRSDDQNLQYSFTAELYLRTNFEIHKRRTLYINCFALGVWIGGLFTYEAIKLLSRRGKYPLTLINPGLNKGEILKAIKNLGNKFDQIIIGGYPPFVKDVIDDGIHSGLDWKKYRIGLIFSAEGFSEEFRDYIQEKTGFQNIYTATLNHYGTVDQGTLAYETPIAVLVRRAALRNEKLFNAVFREGMHRLPTLVQYDPELFFFEEVNNSLVCSSYSGLPLVRYDLKDYGGVVSFESMSKKFIDAGSNLLTEAKQANIENTLWQLPFVYVYERKDMTVSLSGANIYPETIKKALHMKEFTHLITGKFVMIIRSTRLQDQYLEINIELKKGVKIPKRNIKKDLANSIVKHLLKDNSEYRIIFEQKKKNAIPKIVFWIYEDPTYFRVGGKQKWSLRVSK